MNPVFPSILSTSYFDLEGRLSQFQDLGIDFIHLDVMDGHFVDNISFGPRLVKAIKAKFPFQIDAHLMVANPEKSIPTFIASGSDWISIHMESNNKTIENIKAIKKAGKKAGLVLNPDTPLDQVFPYLSQIDYVLLMSVFPGYGGQTFIETTTEKVFLLKKRIQEQGLGCLIQVDGGINAENIGMIKEAGADLFVIGTFLYNSENISETFGTVISKINGV
jgi:ribulose-phosphate 3-epimerase